MKKGILETGILLFRAFSSCKKESSKPNDAGYPIRGIISDDFIFLKNFKTDRWPAGMPETGYLDCDGGPTKTQILNAYNSENHKLWELSFGKRTENEFFNLKKDPDCMENIADKEDSKTDKVFWSNLLMEKLKEQEDPRVLGNGDVFDTYLVFPSQRNFYKRYMNGEQVKQIGSINPISDHGRTPNSHLNKHTPKKKIKNEWHYENDFYYHPFIRSLGPAFNSPIKENG
jgi:hypothetical protein